MRLDKFLVVGVAFLFLLTGPFVLADTDSQNWEDILLEHNILGHSRSLPIHIRFASDIVSQQQVGTSAQDMLTVSSTSNWTANYESTRGIIITPQTAWRSGEKITVTLLAKRIAPSADELSDYTFDVNIVEQTFNIHIDGLSVIDSRSSIVNLGGTLLTADQEPNKTIETIISAKLEGNDVAVDWVHNSNGREHRFIIRDIKKLATAQSLSINWDTKAMGLSDSGSREIIIPEEIRLGVTSIQGVFDGERHIRVVFSNKLNLNQNMSGLIRLNNADAKITLENNVAKIYIPAEYDGQATISVEPGIEDEFGHTLKEAVSKVLTFEKQPPQVKFSGSGVILPNNKYLSIPFETMNVDSVQVTAFQVFENNIGHFLQDNSLSGTSNIHRVGRYLWRKTIKLPNATPDKWQSFSLDATELFQQAPGGLFRLTLSLNRGNSMLECNVEASEQAIVAEPHFENYESNYQVEASSWDYAEDYYTISGSQDSRDPCQDAYYLWSAKAKTSRNYMASNIGIIAKGSSANEFNVITTDIASANVLSDTKVEFYNFQDQVIGTTNTNQDGFATLKLQGKPFYLKAFHGNEQGILKLENNIALPVSHFDVGGESIIEGIKGVIFGERGVWRPGDDIHLTFVMSDETKRLPKNHPVTMRLYDARNRLVKSITSTTPVGNFYRFDFATSDTDITGNWEARAQIGGAQFSKKLKVEMVVPNRLKIDLDFGKEDAILKAGEPFEGHLFSQWLHGAKASNLEVEVDVNLSSKGTHFSRGEDFIFDDPTRIYRGNKQSLAKDSNLDAEGHLYFNALIPNSTNAPGLLTATFTSKVYESTGKFSTAIQQQPYSPYDAYVGIKLPKGDAARGMLLTDTDHTVEVLTLNELGEPVTLPKVSVALYKIDWRWWWEKGADSLGQYSSKNYTEGLTYDVISTNKNGTGSWKFSIAYPEWGRYLVRACDIDGGHCTAKVVYIDWPGWAGRAQESKGVGASALTITADKPKYEVGESARINLPNAKSGRVLISIENGSEVIRQYWKELDGSDTAIDIPITADMAPNVYVNAILLQPHAGKTNDRPIRMYGIVPVMVEDPTTRLNPQLTVPEQWGSSTTASIAVSEENGQAMTYTLMVVDEGLLGLTRYRTPDLHKAFYKKEALGIRTWDMFDDVVGAYGGELERLLALGGGDAEGEDEESKKKRFPPVVKVLGPFSLKAGQTAEHQFEMPQYLGQVRVMLVANHDNAYGSTEQSVYVREAINILPTLPRSVSPGESIAIPTLVFRNEQSLEKVTLEINLIEGDARVEGRNKIDLTFSDSNEQIGLFNLNIGSQLGWVTLEVKAYSAAGEHEVVQTIELPVVSATTPSTWIINQKIDAGKTWTTDIEPHGIAGTNTASLNISSALPFSLDERLNYLIRYPHGCIEQTTSAVFPQLFLNDISTLTKTEQADVEKNVKAAIDRLASFQTNAGGFAYWPGQPTADSWGSNYAGHMLVMAKDKGYSVPNELLSKWLSYQKAQANAWAASNSTSSVLDQAYRLYSLVLAKQADLAAMNRLRVSANLSPVASQLLAEAYYRYGLKDAAESLNLALPSDFADQNDKASYGSSMRNQAIALRSAVVRGDSKQADDLALQLGEAMATSNWYSTQTVAYTLLAFSEYLNGDGNGIDARIKLGDQKGIDIKEAKPIFTQALGDLGDANTEVGITNNLSRPLYASILVEGLPKPGSEVAVANKLDLQLAWHDANGDPLTDLRSLKQGTNIQLTVTVKNTSKRDIENLALTEVFPSGWEIENKRFEGEQTSEVFDYQDVRDDRVMTYFSLKSGEERKFELTLHTTYAGVFFMPGINVEAMYDNTYSAATVGQWTEVAR